MNKKTQAAVFEQFVGPHMTMLYKAAWRLTGRQDEAEELVQDVMVKLFPKTGEILDIEAPGPWLKKVLYREFVDQLRKKMRRPGHYLSDHEYDFADNTGQDANPEILAENAMNAERLQAALDLLDGQQRSIIVMHLAEGYTINEIAAFFDLPAETIKTKLRRTKVKLKKILQG
jgi:RNA polymerase sigma factor (sigma-70 family)